MNKNELLNSIVSILKTTEKEISELKKDFSFEKPIQNDIVKTKKAMAYENILSEVRKYNQRKKED